MPSTIATEDIELIHSGKGPGGGNFSGDTGNGGDSGDSSGASSVPQRAYVTGMFIGLAGILMFFMAFVSAYIVRKGMPASGWIPLQVPRLLWLNTLVLIASSFTLARAHSCFTAKDEDGFRHWWATTTILGTLFVAGQILAWRQLAAEGIFLASNPSSSFFYVFTGAHGLHLLGGILALLYVQFRATRKVARGTAIEVVSMYWHFMDGLWVFLFLLLYLGR
ncbi:MAG TPA: heme-copper oxidase subunit III [Candidatus Acidoferrales bacterium]|nr:heme-copper oxidase subunit III [Candidatus Acidoferrales bacterium]